MEHFFFVSFARVARKSPELTTIPSMCWEPFTLAYTPQTDVDAGVRQRSKVSRSLDNEEKTRLCWNRYQGMYF